MKKRVAGHHPKLEAAQSLGFLMGSCVCLILSLAFAVRVGHRAAGPPSPRPGGQINPNDAPAVSLARLPGIGPTRARAIVALRDELRSREGCTLPFQRAEDLTQVKGIGPATIEGIRPWLRFDPPAGSKETPARQP